MTDSRDNMPCQELVEVITEYLEGTLPLEDRLRFEAHLRICGPCNTYLAQMRETIHLVGEASADSLAPEVRQDLIQAFRNWHAAGIH